MARKSQNQEQPGSVWARRFINFLSSPLFFWLVVLLFVVQAGWIALCARFPQAFDEQFHFGVIQIYSHHLSPFLNSQPVNADQYGAIYRDPSYLYHYLLSFPYRLLSHVTQSTTAQVITLRLLNIAFFVSGLVLFRKVLRYAKVSEALINVSLAFLVLTPVMPLLASQINYDNLLFPMAGIALLFTLKIIEIVRKGGNIAWNLLAYLLLVGILGSLVKYAFIPIVGALIGMIIFEYIRSNKRKSWWQGLHSWVRRPTSLLLILALLLSLGLFWQRFGVNTLRYHTPIPECNQVLNMQRCQSYSPWARNYMFEQMHITLKLNNDLTYPFVWLYHSMGELVFTISSNYNQFGTIDYHVGSQLILIEIIAWSVFAAGLLLGLRYIRWLWAQPVLRLFLLVIMIYVALLGARNMHDYLHTGIPVAIHGRYLLPVLPLIYLIIALVCKRGLDAWHAGGHDAITRKAIVTAVMGTLLLVEGGGFVTYILRSDPSWFWPQNTKVQHANDKVRKVLKPFVIDIGNHPH